jgi:Na+/proline symporter/signal transduction histidine kinase/CheY-like chemotaxis protein
MFELLPIAVALVYALALFAFASWADGAGNDAVKRRLRPAAYALAIAVYCTSWTFYGAVGSAVSDGWSYLPIYLGPILVFGFAHGFLRRLVDAVKADGANSISDFIGGRFGSSRCVAALVTLLALMGSIPYIALQLRSLSTSFTLMSGGAAQPVTMALAAVGLAMFAMIYGTRRYHADGRNDAVLFAVGVESLLKLFALLVAATLAILLIAGNDGAVARDGIAQFSVNFAPDRIDADFFIITLLSMAAIICLPRQFYITVIEARSGDDIVQARWPFIIYMVLTLLVVLPISVAGLSLLPPDTLPDLFVLQLPLSQGNHGVALLVFLGGFSAATAMVLVETIALATMVSNDLIAPSLLRSARFSKDNDLSRALLFVRRGTIALIMLAALGWALGIQNDQRLATIGLVAFAAMAQFAPILILAVYGANRDALAAKAGLTVGMIVWCWTLAFPQIAPSMMIDQFAGTVLDPTALFGIDGLSPISHGTLWSLGTNMLAFVIVTMRRVQTTELPRLLRDAQVGSGSVSTVGELENIVVRFVGPEVAAQAFADLERAARVNRSAARKAERLIAGVVGLPSARALISSALFGSNLTHAEVSRLLDDTGQSLRFSKGLLAATLENIDPGVSVVDRDLNLVAWNSRYLDMFDFPPAMVYVGVPVANLIRYNVERGDCGPGEVEAHVEKRLSHMRRGAAHSFERVRQDGRVFKTVGGPMPSGGYVMCFTDVTVEAQAVAALERARVELETRVTERTHELQAANNALAQSDAEKTRFLAAASHDLLQPIHAARLFAASLGREIAPAQRGVLSKLDRSIESADILLRALLDISRLDAGGVTPQPTQVSLRTLLLALVETFAPLAAEKGLTIRIGPGDAKVETDVGLLHSIVQNFLSNAIRYTGRGGIIVGVRRRGSEARIDVIDSGVGIPDEKRAVIFREFERLASASEGGVGLGLAIVERTARVIGARISLRSTLGKGSRFSVALPIAAKRSVMPKSEPVASPRAQSRQSVLIVDDDRANCDAMESFISQLGHEVCVAVSAEEALRRQIPFDVALIDFNLGQGDDGLTLIAALREQNPDARYALVTATRPADYLERPELRRVSVLRKPLLASDLEAWLDGAPLVLAAE